jgi:superfamily II DNA/RNA helicase
MYDADTVALIRSAPALDGLNLDDLPQRLTEAYASIVAARIRIRAAAPDDGLPAETASLVEDMRRLAFTHEALVSALPNRQDRAAAAFVAGAAHHVSLLAGRVGNSDASPSHLGLQSISPEVSATLLFLVAEASADAAEMAKSIHPPVGDAVAAALLQALARLAKGELEQLLDAPVPGGEQVLAADRVDQGVRALYLLLLKGTRALAATMLGPAAALARGLADVDPQVEFERVKVLCVESFGDLFVEEGVIPFSLYPGPLHLASLLSSVANDLAASALVATPAPNGIDGGRWTTVLQGIAQRRPYLWRNHRQAIESGYLEPGISSAISFPTGAGKSTLAELKIAAALLRGLKVVFLAPTLALVDQTAKALASTFPNAEVQRERAEELLFDFENEALPAVSVMTPERCLALLGFDRDAFADVGLLVFDECHLLHPRDMDRSRRSIDAMLCLLNFTTVAPLADLLLLSAMMSNTVEIAAWIEELTGRPCRPLALNWKPTRQVRGCVVYSVAEINALNAELAAVRAAVANHHAPVALKRRLDVQPFGFFCLRQTWHSAARADYALLPLLDDPVRLATGTRPDRQWYLTPNGNQVAAALGASTATQGLKTLIFTQTIPLTNSATNILTEALGDSELALTVEERRLYDLAVDEAGGSDHVYLVVHEDGRLASSSVCHHGLLMAAERHLHESLFKRPKGVNVMVATSTLAQGMNLPSEVVIIAGDSRFDPAADRMEQLEAHELLNAAGRAGRAGESSYGFVLVVPSKVVHFDNATNQIHNHWVDLRAIFAQSDQCLEIEDPIAPILDQIQMAGRAQTDMARYLVRRLPIGGADDEAGPDGLAHTLLGRSLGAYRARQRDDQAWIDTRIEAALAARRADPEAPEALTWADRLAASAGVPAAVIRSLGEALLAAPLADGATVLDWRAWMAAWLEARPHLIPALIRRESLEGLFGTPYRGLEEDEARGRYAMPVLMRLLGRWMAGATLVEIEREFGTAEHRLGKCEAAREFALRLVPELAYLFGLPAQVFRAQQAEADEATEPSTSLAMLGPCVREGLDRADKIALRQYRKGRASRVAVHREFATIEPYLVVRNPGENFAAAVDRVKDAVEIAELIG